MATVLLRTVNQRSRWVRGSVLARFCVQEVAQLIPLPLACFFTRSLYDAIKTTTSHQGRYPERTVRLHHAALRDLQSWATILSGDGRIIGGGQPSWCFHTDAANVGYGGTFGQNMNTTSTGKLSVQGTWLPFLRLKWITYRELVAVQKTLECDLIQARHLNDDSIVMLHVDNIGVFHILSNIVSANPALVSELRRRHHLLVQLKSYIRAACLPSVLNKHVDLLSRSWNPRDLMVTP